VKNGNKTAAPARKRLFTAQKYHQMVAADILTRDDCVELVQGEKDARSPN